MNWVRAIRVLFDSEHGAKDRLGPRWLFLRSLGGIYFSAFFSLVFQIRGLMGPEGILPPANIPAVACRPNFRVASLGRNAETRQRFGSELISSTSAQAAV
jgi:hypothetical protein